VFLSFSLFFKQRVSCAAVESRVTHARTLTFVGFGDFHSSFAQYIELVAQSVLSYDVVAFRIEFLKRIRELYTRKPRSSSIERPTHAPRWPLRVPRTFENVGFRVRTREKLRAEGPSGSRATFRRSPEQISKFVSARVCALEFVFVTRIRFSRARRFAARTGYFTSAILLCLWIHSRDRIMISRQTFTEYGHYFSYESRRSAVIDMFVKRVLRIVEPKETNKENHYKRYRNVYAIY